MNNILHTQEFELKHIQSLVELLVLRNYWVGIMNRVSDPTYAISQIDMLNVQIKDFLKL